MSRDWLLYLDDLIESYQKFRRAVVGLTAETFASNEIVFDAVLFNLQIIGESVKKIPAEVRALNPQVDWSAPARLRDLIAHHDFAIEARIVWDVVAQHLPRLLEEASVLRERFDRA